MPSSIVAVRLFRRFAWALAQAPAALVASACAPRPIDLTPGAPGPPTCLVVGCGLEAGGGPRPGRDGATEGHPGEAPAGGEDPPGGAAPSSGCAGLDAATCTARALDAWSAADAAGTAQRVLPAIAAQLADACALGEARACLFAGRIGLDPAGREQTGALAMLLRACDGGLAAACVAGARWVDEPQHVKDVPHGQELHDRFEVESACWEGQSDACFRAAVAASAGPPASARDRALADRLYARGCDLGDSRACNGLGVALDYGEGVARDVGRSARSFWRACRLGDALGCANFGYMAEYGEGVARDRRRARDLYRQACLAGDTYGCLHLDMMAAQDGGAPLEAAAALATWTRACDRDRSARACAFAGVLYEDGPAGVARDEAKSLAAMERACALHEPRACDWVKAHAEEAAP